MQCATEIRRIGLKLDKYTVTVSLDGNVLIVSYKQRYGYCNRKFENILFNPLTLPYIRIKVFSTN